VICREDILPAGNDPANQGLETVETKRSSDAGQTFAAEPPKIIMCSTGRSLGPREMAARSHSTNRSVLGRPRGE